MLAWPILLGQLAVICNGVLDTAMTSRVSANDLAALALGSSIYISVFVGASGVLQALSPAISQLNGARDYAAIGAEVKQGVWLAIFLSIAGGALLSFPQPLLALAHAPSELHEKSSLYLRWLAPALPATLGFRIYSSLNHALARPKNVMAIQVVMLALKVPANVLFIYGGLGLPALGGPGAAVATSVVSWMTFAIGWLLLRHGSYYEKFRIFEGSFPAPDWKAQCALLKLGIPMGMGYLIEVTAFTFMALFIARLGEIVVGGHQITANFGTMLYMVPLAIASATGTLVAHAVGARRFDEAQRIGDSGIRLAAVVSVLLGMVIWFSRSAIIRAYTPEESVIAAAMPLFAFISFYQLFDSIQVTTAFVLRAYKVVVVPTLIYAVALWGVGLGGGFILGFDSWGLLKGKALGAAGFWLGNSISLGLVAIGLFIYLRQVQTRLSREEK
ncbi:MAG: family efflux transporter [Paucimonas sp.]|nr:family efflux transporter [Paucimonas sp.]